ncbi:MAG: hypothetical protein SOR40_01540 [Rothia sp. (in: high G+C Gram-positive bacteria)]|nr:hypothetical protein [Rothia sp. (in: high G+C Gram-positive bacteria)]
MSQQQLTVSQTAQALHPIFDQQIINYGAYNLIFARGQAHYQNPDVAGLQEEDQRFFIIGYRDTPTEAIIAPLALPQLASAGSPTSVDTTNAARTYFLPQGKIGIELSNGSSFTLELEAEPRFTCHLGLGQLEQAKDIEDFKKVIIEAWAS